MRFAGDGRFLLLDAGTLLTKVSNTSFEAVSSQYREQNEQSARSGTWQVLQRVSNADVAFCAFGWSKRALFWLME